MASTPTDVKTCPACDGDGAHWFSDSYGRHSHRCRLCKGKKTVPDAEAALNRKIAELEPRVEAAKAIIDDVEMYVDHHEPMYKKAMAWLSAEKKEAETNGQTGAR